MKLNKSLWSKCFKDSGGQIFGEYFADVDNKPYTLRQISDCIKKDIFGVGDEYWDDFKTDWPTEMKKLLSLIETSKDPVTTIKAWNEFYISNGETHGTVFGMLFYGEHLSFLNELLEELEGFDKYGIGWDT